MNKKMVKNNLLSFDVIKNMNVDILEIDEKIQVKFTEEKKKIEEYKEMLKEYLKIIENDDLRPRIKKSLLDSINELEEYIEDLEKEKMKNFYMLETAEIVNNYKKILQKPEKQTFFGKTNKSDKMKKQLVSNFMKISRKYLNVKDFDSTLETIGSKSVKNDTKNSKIICNNCDSKEFELEECNIYICLQCSSQQFILNNVTSFKDINRVNISSKYCYDRRVHFRDSVNQYQGKQNSFISPTVYSELIKQFELHQLVNTEEKDNKKKFSRIKKEHLFIFLKELGYTKHYENINLIYYNITGVKPDDIGYLESKLMNDFDTITEAYDRLFKHLDRKNFINTQYILYQLLMKHKHPCKKEDFSMLKTIDRKNFHDEICKVLFEEIKFSFNPLY